MSGIPGDASEKMYSNLSRPITFAVVMHHSLPIKETIHFRFYKWKPYSLKKQQTK